MQTRKDFRMTAELIKAMDNREQALHLAQKFAKSYALMNPRFSYEKFYKACEVTV